MFLKSLAEAFTTLVEWRFWFVAIIYGLLAMAPAFIFGGKTTSQEKPFPQTNISRFLWILWCTILFVFSILFLAPVLLQDKHAFGWTVFRAVNVGGYLTLAIMTVILSFVESKLAFIRKIPPIGGTLRAFTTVGVVLFLLSGGSARVLPSVLVLLCLSIIGVILAYLIAALITIFIALTVPLKHKDAGMQMLTPLSSFITLMPAVIYAGWLRVANIG